MAEVIAPWVSRGSPSLCTHSCVCFSPPSFLSLSLPSCSSLCPSAYRSRAGARVDSDGCKAPRPGSPRARLPRGAGVGKQALFSRVLGGRWSAPSTSRCPRPSPHGVSSRRPLVPSHRHEKGEDSVVRCRGRGHDDVGTASVTVGVLVLFYYHC